MKSEEIKRIAKHNQQLRAEAEYYKKIAATAGAEHLRDVAQLSDIISELNETKTKLERAREELEDKVVERTEELSKKNLTLQQEITERRQAEQALLESEKRFRELAETIQEVFWIGAPDWSEVLYVSPAYEKIWGQSCASLYEQPLSWLDPLPEEDRKKVLSFLEERVDGDLSIMVFPEYRVVQSDRSIRWIAARSYPIHDKSGTIVRVAGIAEDITKRKQAEETLRRYEHIISATNDQMSFVDRDHIYQAVNEAYLQAFQKTRQEITGHPVAELLGDDIFERLVKEKLDRCLAGEAIHYQAWFDFPGTGRRYMDVSYNPFLEIDGEITGVVVSSRNITDLKQAEQALKESETRFRSIFQDVPDAMVLTNTKREIVLINPALANSFGYNLEEIQGQKNSVLYESREEYEHQRRIRFNLTAEEQTKPYVLNYKRKNGTIFPGETVGTTIKDENGTPVAFLGVIRDITERKKSEDIIRNIAAGVAASTGREFFRNLVTRIANTLGVKYAMIAQLISDSRGQTLAIVNENEIRDNFDFDLKGTLCERVIQQGVCCYPSKVCKQFPKDHRLQNMEIESYIGIPLLSADQEILGLLVAMDTKPLQKQKQATSLLEIFAARATAELERVRGESQLQLAANVFENIDEGVVVTDTHAKIVAINKAVSEITGYSEKELLGQNPRLWKSEHHDAAFYQAMWSSLTDTLHWRGEIWNRRKNGEIFPAQMTITGLKNEDGKLSNYVSVFSDISTAKESQEMLEHLAQYDQLTNIPNRRLLYDRLRHALSIAGRRELSLGLLLLDLDGFKTVNDTLGHKSGDLLLIQVAKRLLQCVRESDTVARLGGDEFVVLLPDCKTAENVTNVTRKILEELASPFDIEGNDIFVSASIGVTMYPDDGNKAEILLKNADTAMYHIKDTGKNNFQFFTASMQEHIVKRLQLTSQLRYAMEREEFLLHYQPKMDLVTGRINGMEALVRWQHPDVGLVNPADFILLAEETGIIIPLGKWVLRQACLQMKAWKKEGLDSLRVSVNLSARQFQDEELVEMVETVLLDTGIEAGFLELEITESTIMQDIERTIETLWQLRNLGILLSIDDFGTGYSSLNYLKRFPLDILKIDQSFVMDITTDPNDRAVVEAIVSLSRHLKMKVVAEGVETEEQLDFLKKQKCHEVQGNYIAKPLAVDEFKVFIQKHRQTRA